MIQSPHFARFAHRMVYALTDKARAYPNLALRAAERIVTEMQSDTSGELSPHSGGCAFHKIGELVVSVCAVHAEQALDQSPALDLVDRFLETEAYTMVSELAELDRRN